MKDLKEFNIQFVGLKLGNHVFEYEIDNKFFKAFDFDEFHNSNVKVTLDFAKKNNMFELNFYAKGMVNLDCDISLEAFDQEIEGNFPLIVKFGPEFNDDNDEIFNSSSGRISIKCGTIYLRIDHIITSIKKNSPQSIGWNNGVSSFKKIKKN